MGDLLAFGIGTENTQYSPGNKEHFPTDIATPEERISFFKGPLFKGFCQQRQVLFRDGSEKLQISDQWIIHDHKDNRLMNYPSLSVFNWLSPLVKSLFKFFSMTPNTFMIFMG